MKDLLLKYSADIIVLGLIICYPTDIQAFNLRIEEGMKVYCNGFTYIVVNSDFELAQIYDMEINPHNPVLLKDYFRGDFHLHHIKDNFYSIINKDLPGKKCIENMEVTSVPSDSGYITARFKLGNCNERYVVMAESIRNDSIYSIVYPIEEEMHFPIDECGYRFSIRPSDSNDVSMAGITYGFSPTIKYLNLKEMHKDLFSSGGLLEISLPLFDDSVFDSWCINGDILQINHQILNDKIVWHGKEFRLYDRIQDIFNF